MRKDVYAALAGFSTASDLYQNIISEQLPFASKNII